MIRPAHLANMSLEECDALGYWRRALRRRSEAHVRAMSGSDKVQMSFQWTAARRRAARERLKRRRPAITEAAICDMFVSHALRDSESERSMARRCSARPRTR